jgi:hypothetical protein
MTKIVYNTCFGGFSLSDAAIRRYAELKGLTLYPEEMALGGRALGLTTYWTVSPEQRKRDGVLIDESTEWWSTSLERRQAHNAYYTNNTISRRDMPRTDPVLVAVVEELGEAANGRVASLAIRELPEGTKYRIDEHDGNERVVTVDEYKWETA